MFEQDAVALLPAVFFSFEVEALTAAAAALTLKSQSLQLKSSSSETMKRIFAAANKLIPLFHQVYAGLVLPIVAGFLAVLGQEFMRPLCVCVPSTWPSAWWDPGWEVGRRKWSSAEQDHQDSGVAAVGASGDCKTTAIAAASAYVCMPLHVLFCKVVCWKVLLRKDVGKCCSARMMLSAVVHTEEGSGGCFSLTEDK